MNVDEIKELIKDLIKVVNESGIAEVEVQMGGDRVRIQRAYPHQSETPAAVYTLPAAIPTLPPQAAAIQAQTPAAPAIAAGPVQPTAEETTVLVKSPIVGTFYESPSPGSPAFVKIGDKVTPGQVLCIIESMKLMNEIEAEVSGILVSRLVENGRPVEYGEALFSVKPS